MNMNTRNKDAAVVIFSGGQDSTTCLLWALKRYREVVAVSFDYGQKHKAELECAKEITDELGVEWHVMDMGLLNQLAPNSLTRQDITVDENAPEEGTPNSVVDGRNMLFLTFAAVFAKQRGITDLITGVSQSDFSGYPDCRDIDKADTWKLADDLGGLELVHDKTLTCYNGIKGDGCGNCPSCKLRRKGYEEFLKKYK